MKVGNLGPRPSGPLFLKGWDIMVTNYLSWVEDKELDYFKKSKFGCHIYSSIMELIKKGNISGEYGEKALYHLIREYYSCYNNPKNVWKEIGFFMDSFYNVFDITDILIEKNKVRKFIVPINHIVTKKAIEILKFKDCSFKIYEEKFEDKEIDFLVIIEDFVESIWYKQRFGEAFNLMQSGGLAPGLYFFTNDSNVGSIYKTFGYSMDVTFGDGGLRKDLNMSFRSSWESNFARILNHLNLSWEYEANDKFEVEIGTKTTYYHPDFKVKINENSYWWYEIKGFWDNASLQKVASFNKNYPMNKLNIIDSDIFYYLQNRFSNLVENWENIQISSHSNENVKVVGIKFNKRIEKINKLIDHEEIFLERDNQNQYDQNAVKVISKDGEDIGFICKEWAAIYSYKLDIGFKFKAYLESKHYNDNYINIKVERIGDIPEDFMKMLFGL